jgi:hypothetical protein
MSIVYDYLKKIHDQKETKKVISEVSSAQKRSGYPLWVKIMAGILGCLLVGAGLYFFLPKIEKTILKPHLTPEKPRAVQPETPDFNFLLDGIIYNPSKPFAIIDGKMYETGGRFGDFEVTQITPDTVLLKNVKDNTSHTARL